MKLCVFMSECRSGSDLIDRLEAEKLGIILVCNGVYHAAADYEIRSWLFPKNAHLYVLAEDLESRAIETSRVAPEFRVITYSDIVDLIFNEYEKTIWI
ncbi:MAG: hypothetical protein JXR79_04350 [Nitrospirae bacterium]|nr:hypothetical protein [Nitrospirota bacterium]